MKGTELLLKSASFIRDLSGQIQELEKTAQAKDDLLLAVERLEVLEKMGQRIASKGDSVIERARALIQSPDYQKLAVLADTGSEECNIGRPDVDSSSKPMDAMDRGVYHGYDDDD
jgi:hypothetical protein